MFDAKLCYPCTSWDSNPRQTCRNFNPTTWFWYAANKQVDLPQGVGRLRHAVHRRRRRHRQRRGGLQVSRLLLFNAQLK